MMRNIDADHPNLSRSPSSPKEALRATVLWCPESVPTSHSPCSSSLARPSHPRDPMKPCRLATDAKLERPVH